MTLTLKEYIETIRIPPLSYHVKYSELFERQYDRLNKELVGVIYPDKPIVFYCWKAEYDEFTILKENHKLIYKDQIISEKGSLEYLIEYSFFFGKGYNSIEYDSPANVIINNIPFCSTQKCIKSENKNEVIGLGRKCTNIIPCIAGNRPFTFDSLFGAGLLNAVKINNINDQRTLKNPQKSAFNDGVMFKSIFQVIERYSEFKEFFEYYKEPSKEFVQDLLNGIRELQTQDENAECIRVIKQKIKKDEFLFRDWFKTYFSVKYQTVNAESEKGNGRIDLKIQDKNVGTKIIEFKGWWNDDKKNVTTQIINYLTDFENDGYIIIINHNKRKNISKDYLKLIETEEMGYVKNSLIREKFTNTDFEYFTTYHSDKIRTKSISHFILNVY